MVADSDNLSDDAGTEFWAAMEMGYQPDIPSLEDSHWTATLHGAEVAEIVAARFNNRQKEFLPGWKGLYWRARHWWFRNRTLAREWLAYSWLWIRGRCTCEGHSGGWVGSIDYVDAVLYWDPCCRVHHTDPNEE